ncbi:tRNA modification GTPase gtpbp3, mitochondrial [Spiromyces aspiralis]|uniref:tRNA modification GTPase gtpbp3, mitochondrial n=1 Tax=Spiromyces aspiralis TaxID=68401 RepID=A0ACC1HP96_9FUNG|nr:tRNA modification GTPase gtpbp3, mitochondrial [Spiromyces aspiralis]
MTRDTKDRELGLPKPRYTSLRRIVSPEAPGDTIDIGLTLRFAAPNSFTGEDMVELHVHGGNAVVVDVLEGLSKIRGFRMAEPGEFSRRQVQGYH